MTEEQDRKVIDLLTEIRDQLTMLNDKLGNWNQPLPVQVQGPVEVHGAVTAYDPR